MKHQLGAHEKVFKCLMIVLLGSLLSMMTIGSLWAWPVPDTGQTKCYNNTAEIPCPAPGEPFYGQDGNYSIDPPSYTKLDANGAVLSDDAATWAMIKDNVTGLLWENKTSDGSIHDGAKRFTWCDMNPANNGGNQGECGTSTGNAATDTEAFIKALNDVMFGGFSDWRMPTPKELTTIVDRSLINPAVTAAWFPNTMLNYYWSSTDSADGSGNAWTVVFLDGTVDVLSGNKTSAQAVRAVRGGQSRPFAHLIINGDGTVSDTATGLMWQQGTVSGKNWEAALSYAEGLDLAGFSDWRLPYITELQTIVDFSRYNPAIDTTFFPGTVSSLYWSSTTYAYYSGYAWYVYFSSGYVSYDGIKAYVYPVRAVRAVRGGQSRLFGHLFISTPQRADRWNIGEQKTITWDTAGISGNVNISLSRQGGKAGTFETILRARKTTAHITGPLSVPFL
jgi:Protein of unknown function (DUF1566)